MAHELLLEVMRSACQGPRWPAQAWRLLGARYAARLALTFYACLFRSTEREKVFAELAQSAHQDEALRAAAIDMLRDMEPKTLLSSFCCLVAVGVGLKTQYELYATAAKADPACAQAFSRMGDIRWELSQSQAAKTKEDTAL
jgi:hypothetical protein